MTVVAEVGDFQRFDNPRQLMAYLGLTPSEHSSGASVRRGGITKAGSGLARRALVEGAWSYRMQARVSPKLLARLASLPQALAMVTATPARTVGLDDRGRIATGLRADLVRVRRADGVPVWCMASDRIVSQ